MSRSRESTPRVACAARGNRSQTRPSGLAKGRRSKWKLLRRAPGTLVPCGAGREAGRGPVVAVDPRDPLVLATGPPEGARCACDRELDAGARRAPSPPRAGLGAAQLAPVGAPAGA